MIVNNIARTKSELPISKEDNIYGLTDKEQKIMDKLKECIDDFMKLDFQHPEDNREFFYAIHLIQGLLSLRVVRRCYPDGWPTYKLIDGD